MVACHTSIPARVEIELTEGSMTREQIMLGIRSINPTATMDFLRRFSLQALERYMCHLESASQPRGPEARWVREPETPAVIGFIPGDD